jgi:hypothetical protein
MKRERLDAVEHYVREVRSAPRWTGGAQPDCAGDCIHVQFENVMVVQRGGMTEFGYGAGNGCE